MGNTGRFGDSRHLGVPVEGANQTKKPVAPTPTTQRWPTPGKPETKPPEGFTLLLTVGLMSFVSDVKKIGLKAKVNGGVIVES